MISRRMRMTRMVMMAMVGMQGEEGKTGRRLCTKEKTDVTHTHDATHPGSVLIEGMP